MTKTAFIYTRISQARGGDELGVQRQEKACRDYGESHGFQVVMVYSDNDTSAYSGKVRPQYKAMLNRLEAREVDAVIVWRMDRLHRRPIELEEYADIVKGGKGQEPIYTYAVTGGGKIDLASADGLLRAGIMGQVARFESATKSERAKAKAAQKAAAGEWNGGARPFGWTPEGRGLKILKREAVPLAAAHHDVLNGKSLGAIIRDWNDPDRDGGPLLTTAGKPWGYAQLRQALLRPRNAGLYEFNGQILHRDSELLPPIVSEDIWRAIKSLLTDPSRRRSQSNKAVHLLAGIAQCYCGTPARSATVSDRRGEKYLVYRCTMKGEGHVGKRKNYVDNMVRLAVFRSIFFGIETAVQAPEAKRRAVELQTQLKALDSREREAGTALADGALTITQVVSFNAQIKAKRVVIEEELASLGRVTRPAVGPMRDFGADNAEAEKKFREWLAQPIDDQRDYVRSRFHVIMYPHSKGSSRVFDPDTVLVVPRELSDAPGPLTPDQVAKLERVSHGQDAKVIYQNFVELFGL